MLDSFYPLLKILFPKLTWDRKTTEKLVYLTFDDGPIPDLTEFVLTELKKYNQKATFFCVGDNIRKNPDIFRKIIEDGHKVGNHTYNHLKGWETENNRYFHNLRDWEKELQTQTTNVSVAQSATSMRKLFRPPYGRIKKSQLSALSSEYEIVMWSVLTQDYNRALSPETVLKKAINGTRSGAIVVFHDNLKAEANIRYALPRYLEYLHQHGFTSSAL